MLDAFGQVLAVILGTLLGFPLIYGGCRLMLADENLIGRLHSITPTLRHAILGGASTQHREAVYRGIKEILGR